jgi:hypothetical protein
LRHSVDGLSSADSTMKSKFFFQRASVFCIVTPRRTARRPAAEAAPRGASRPRSGARSPDSAGAAATAGAGGAIGANVARKPFARVSGSGLTTSVSDSWHAADVLGHQALRRLELARGEGRDDARVVVA